jgi:RNA polymerase-interacting CarD/CdnL/TRCF family regulator
VRRIKEIEAPEEDMMCRLPMTKKDRQMMRDVERMQGSLDAIMDYERQPKQKQKARPPQKKHVRRKR